MEEPNNKEFYGELMPVGDISPDLAYSKRILLHLLALDAAFIKGNYNEQMPILSTLYQELASRDAPKKMADEYKRLVKETNLSLVKYNKASARGSKKINRWLHEINNYLIQISLLLRKEALSQLLKVKIG